MNGKRVGTVLFFILLVGSSLLLLRLFWSYLPAIMLALLITGIFYPIHKRILSFLRENSSFAALLTTLLVLLVLVIPAGWFFTILSNEAFDFYVNTRDAVSIGHLQDILESDNIWVQRLRRFAAMGGIDVDQANVAKLSSAVGKNVGLFLYKQVSNVASNLLSFLVHFFLMIMTIFFLFRDGARLKSYLVELLPVPREQLEKVAHTFYEMGRVIIVVNGLSGLTQGFLGGLGFFLFGMKSPFLWGTVIAFMAFLPIIGASIVFLPATAIMILQGHLAPGILFLAYNVFYSSIIEYLIKPRLIGQGVHMNSLLVFIGIIGGIKLYGIMGILYGPLAITVFLTLAEIYRLEYQEASV
ncbi:conserved membrane hypothetical protein [uncultured Desulfatiglans sp.]|nr:conserved membrane hypothetical protein [uncultured Desulfatiglans sp.]